MKKRNAETARITPPENTSNNSLERRETPAEAVARETLAKIKAAEDTARKDAPERY